MKSPTQKAQKSVNTDEGRKSKGNDNVGGENCYEIDHKQR